MNSTSPSFDVGRFRKLRIAWSVFGSLACVLLIVLWVRSYSWIDGASMPITGSRHVVVYSSTGRLSFRSAPYGKPNGPFNVWWVVHDSIAKEREAMTRANIKPDRQYFGPSRYGFLLPHAFVAAIAAIVAALPWLRWPKRFTLRTLLIATTLIAVVLGLAVWQVRR
jgi:hypothetical protein